MLSVKRLNMNKIWLDYQAFIEAKNYLNLTIFYSQA